NVTYERYKYDANNSGNGQMVNGILSIDATDPSKPSVLSNFQSSSTFQSDWNYFSAYYNYGYMPTQENIVRTDTALVFMEQKLVSQPTQGSYGQSFTYTYSTRLRVVDLTDPTKPVQGLLSLPKADGYSGLVVDGANVMLSHYDVSGTGKAKFYLDRIDLSTPGAPKLASKINVPGSLLHYDKAHGRLLTSELVRTVVEDLTAEACYKRFAYADWETPDTTTYTVTTPKPGAAVPSDAGSAASNADGGVGMALPAPVQPPDPTGTCTGYTQQLQLVRFVDGGAVRDDTYKLGERERVSSSSLGDGRVAAIVSHGWTGWYNYGIVDGACYDCGYGYGYGYGRGESVGEPVDVLTLGGFDTGHFTPGRLSVANQQDPWWGWWGAPPVYANGNHAMIRSQSDAVIVDLTDTTKPTILSKTPIYSYATDLNASGNLVIMSLGEQGVERIDL
ncbi:MAG: hypothetical protein JWN04_2587, partial [Myxococcaceae bacterium]|nr:hypothetical protein [Myxococcaceae bacterium]